MKRNLVFIKLMLVQFVFIISLAQAQTGVYTLNGGTALQTSQTYTTTATDESSVYVLNSGVLTLNNCILIKTGDASDVNLSSQYGTNAALLVKSAGSVTVSGGNVTTNASGANGLFATGTGSAIAMTNGTIDCTGASAHGVDVTYGGSITLTNVDVTTHSANSSAVATDFGGGTVLVNGGTIISSATASGSHSAGIYSTGTITVNNADVTSVADAGGVIDGANSIILNNTALTGKTEGIMMWKTAPAAGNAIVTITGGSLTATDGDAFYFNGASGNTATAVVTVSAGATINASTGNIINAVSPAIATFVANAETLSGNIISTGSSTINVALQNNTSLTGAINNGNTAALVTLTMDCSSTWTVTATSHINGLITNPCITGTSVSNIIGNGNNVYYTPATSSALGGLTYSLVNGGLLLPEGSSAIVEIDQSGNSIQLSISPNPSVGHVNVVFYLEENAIVDLKIIDVNGSLLQSNELSNLSIGKNEMEIFLDNRIVSGIYVVQLHVVNQSGIRTEAQRLIFSK